MMNFMVTEPAAHFLIDMLNKSSDAIGVCLTVQNPGTPRAETIMSYQKAEDTSDLVHYETHGLSVYVNEQDLVYLDEAVLDFEEEMGGGTLTVKAPNTKVPKLGDDATLAERVNYFLWTEVNPEVAAHGGEVNLVEITEDGVAILSFGGGCQGCAQVDMTLKYGVEEQLLAAVPEITGIRDVTDHSDQTNAYFK